MGYLINKFYLPPRPSQPLITGANFTITPEKCYRAAEDALMVAVATMIECGQRPPQPASAGRRTEQVNVRLTAEEKLLFANAAMSLGFKGVSDFIRNTALNSVLSNR